LFLEKSSAAIMLKTWARPSPWRASGRRKAEQLYSPLG
jgi:hypothetical protein